MPDAIVAIASSSAFSFDTSLFVYTTSGVLQTHAVLPVQHKGILARRPSDGHIFVGNGNSGNIFEFDQTGATFIQSINVFTPPGNDLTLLQFIGSHVYVGYPDDTPRSLMHVQKRNASDFSLVSSVDYDSSSDFPGTGVNNFPQAVTADETKVLFTATGGGGTNQNRIYSFPLGGGSGSVFASYGTYAAGVGYLVNTGIPTNPSQIKARSDGSFVALYQHTNGSYTDGCRLVIFNSSGTQIQDIDLGTYASTDLLPLFLALSLDELSAWITGLYDDTVPSYFQQLRLSDGTLLTSFPSQSGMEGDLLITSVAILPTPPTTPPSVLVNSNACCGATSGGPPSAGPVEPPIDAAWVPSCAGGGLVPTVPELTLAELWDY